MTAGIFSALGAPLPLEWVAVLSLVLIFLLVEIPLVLSIFRADAMDGSNPASARTPGSHLDSPGN
jgi:hypothetical protein